MGRELLLLLSLLQAAIQPRPNPHRLRRVLHAAFEKAASAQLFFWSKRSASTMQILEASHSSGGSFSQGKFFGGGKGNNRTGKFNW